MLHISNVILAGPLRLVCLLAIVCLKSGLRTYQYLELISIVLFNILSCYTTWKVLCGVLCFTTKALLAFLTIHLVH